MRFVIIFLVTFYCIYQHVLCNQQDPNDPNKPFWATRGRRSGGKSLLKADDDTQASKWQYDEDGTEALDRDSIRRREQAEAVASFARSVMKALGSPDPELRKRGDGKPIDPNGPFWAARG